MLKCETREKVATASPEVLEEVGRIQKWNADLGLHPEAAPAAEPEVAKQAQPQADREAGL